MGLDYLLTDSVTYADGTYSRVDLYECGLDWDGRRLTVSAHCLEGTPLIGMRLLRDCALNVQVRAGGQVEIAPLVDGG